MQFLIIGDTHAAQLSVATTLQAEMAAAGRTVPIFDAAAEATALFAESPAGKNAATMPSEAVEALRQVHSLARLQETPEAGLDDYNRWRYQNQDEQVLVIGVLSPDEFITMVQGEGGNVVIELIAPPPAQPTRASALALIQQYVSWKLSYLSDGAIILRSSFDAETLNIKMVASNLMRETPIAVNNPSRFSPGMTLA